MLADYETERHAFKTLLQEDCPERILLLHGKSGSGKTTLISHCKKTIPEAIPCIPIELKESTVNIAEIFYLSGRCLDWKNLTNFTDHVAYLQGMAHVQIDHNFIRGINNRINVAIHAESQIDRDHRRAALTEAWFNDLEAFDRPVLFIIDTYEKGTTEVQRWINGPFLARTAMVNQVRVLIAGQSIPDANNIVWGQCSITQRLIGVPEAHHWLPVVKTMNRYIPGVDPLSWLAGVCHALKGQPDEIMKIIEALPRNAVEV